MELRFPPDVEIPAGKRILTFHGPLIREGRVLISEIDLDLIGPGKNALIGPNGIGKSTLLETLYEVNQDRQDIRLGYMPQSYEEDFPKEGTILSFLCSDSSKDSETRVRGYLGSLRFKSEEMLYPLSSLSGGMKAKLYLLKMVLEKKNVLLLDEPTRNLSPFSAKMLDNLLDSFKGCALIVSHDQTFLARQDIKTFALSKEGLIAVDLKA